VAAAEGASPTYAEIVGTTAWNSAGLLASNGLVQFAMVYVVAVGPTGPAGRFAAAMSLATPASMLAQALSQVLIPRFSHASAAGDADSVRAYRRTLGGMALVLGALFGVGVLLSPIVVLVIYGAAYEAAIPLMQILLVAMYFFSIGLIASSYLLSTHRARTSTVCSAAGSVLGLVVLVGGGGVLGVAQAAAVGVLVGYGVSAVAAIAVSVLGAPLGATRRRAASVG
jgi:O-antigen/teichoic acid export membrane protein